MAVARRAARRLGGRLTVHERFGTATVATDGFAFDLAGARRERYERPGALPEVELGATLGEDLGRYAFRPFSYNFSPKAKGKQTIMARAFNKLGQGQPAELIQNPAGYHHNVMHSVTLNVA